MGRKVIGCALAVVLSAGAYASAPIVAAVQIREAVRSGDTARLEEKVDWNSVRKALKASIGESRKVIGELTDAAGVPRPGMWQRLKVAVLPFLADPVIDRYVSAEGVPKLYAWRQTWGERIHVAGDAARAPFTRTATSPAATPRGWLDGFGLGRMVSAARRVKRWSFVSPARFEIDLLDRIARGRTWQAVLELRGLSWKLTEMRIVNEAPPTPTPGDVEMARMP